MRRWWSRHRHDIDADGIREEMDAHLAMRVEENIARGLPHDEARREAVRRMGSVDAAARRSLRIRRRQASFRRAVAVDLQHALQAMMRAPLTSLAGVLVAAIGLGTVFAAWWLTGALLHTPPAGVVRPNELYSVLEAIDSSEGRRPRLMSYESFQAMASASAEAPSFAWGGRDLQVIHEGRGRVVPAAMVTGGYFDTLGLAPHAGRLLHAGDGERREPVCVLSLRLARRLSPNPAVLVDRWLSVNGQSFVIAGIAPARFHGLEAGHPVDLWLPVELEPAISTVSVLPDGRAIRGYLEARMGWMRGAVRIRGAMSPAAIEARMTAAVKAAAPNDEVRAVASAVLADRIWLSPWPVHRERLAAVLSPLQAAAAVTLLLTAACLGSLFTARIAERSREFATRLSLGAARIRILRLAALEMLAVVGAGAALAWVAASGMLRAAGPLLLADGVTVEGALTGSGSGSFGELTTLAGVVALLAITGPLLVAARMCGPGMADRIRGAGPGPSFRRLLVAGQMAAGCALLAAAALLTQSMAALNAQPLGFDARGVSFVELNPSGAGLSDDDRSTLVTRLLERHTPVREIAIADSLPFGGQEAIFAAPGDPAGTGPMPILVARIAGPYFNTLGITLVAGRLLDSRDARRPVALISEPLAARWWPGQNAVGRTLRIGLGRGRPHEIVGVVGGVRDQRLNGRPTTRIYLPLGDEFEALVLLARRGSLEVGADPLVAQAREIDARLVPLRSGSVQHLVERTLEQRRVLQAISAITGLGSLLMIGAGVWGLSYGSLRRRWREFGIRQALGATRAHVGRLVLRDAAIVSLVGGACGLVGAWQLGRALRGWLFGVSPHEPWLLALAVAAVVGAALAGAAGPARQALRSDPATLLRDL